jgi:hypothetical protein
LKIHQKPYKCPLGSKGKSWKKKKRGGEKDRREKILIY